MRAPTLNKKTWLVLAALTLLLLSIAAGLGRSSGDPETLTLPKPEATPYAEWAAPGSVNTAEKTPARTGSRPLKLTSHLLGEGPIEPVGLNRDGSAEVPRDPGTLGWYEPLGIPDGIGNDVLVGHVSYNGKRGVFYNLEKMQAGEEILLQGEEGEKKTYKVVSVKSYKKTETPLKELYNPNGPEQLILITCSGEFNELVRHYENNTVVVAVPA